MGAASFLSGAVLPVLLSLGPRCLWDPLPCAETWGGAAASGTVSDFRPLAGLAHFHLFPKEPGAGAGPTQAPQSPGTGLLS